MPWAQVAYQVTKEAHDDGLLDKSEFSATMDELKATFRTNINVATGGRLKEEQIQQLEHEALFPPVRVRVCASPPSPFGECGGGVGPAGCVECVGVGRGRHFPRVVRKRTVTTVIIPVSERDSTTPLACSAPTATTRAACAAWEASTSRR